MDDDGCRRTARQRAAARNAAAYKQGKIAAAVRREPEATDDDGCVAPMRRTAKNLLLQQDAGNMRPIAAATGSGSTLLAGTTRAREPERVWNGRLATALQQRYARRHDRLLRRSPVFIPAGRSVQDQTTTPIVMSPSINWVGFRALSLRQLPASSLRFAAVTTGAHRATTSSRSMTIRARRYGRTRSTRNPPSGCAAGSLPISTPPGRSNSRRHRVRRR